MNGGKHMVPERLFSIILFDLGNVLMKVEYTAFLRTLGLDHAMSDAELYHLLEEESQAFEMGKATAEDFLGVVNAKLGKSYTFDQFREAWLSIVPNVIPGSPDLIDQLSREYRLMLLSNTNELHLRRSVKMLPALRRFERLFVSYEIGLIKPDGGIYQYVLDHVDVPAQRILFIDDLEKNIQAAREVGMHGIVFRGIESARAELQRLNVI
jgi:HAD superfamily hydrolase (TIGR01509 family)